MASKYKIGGKAILTDSDGTRDLIAESVVYEDTFTATNTIRSLAPDYFTDYFPTGAFQGSTSGYASGGGPLNKNTIDKFPFSVDANATDVGNLTQGREYISGQSSNENGYVAGGTTGVSDDLNTRNIIDKFPFSVDANATDVGDLTQARHSTAGQSSTENGYVSGGGAPDRNTIDKFSFSSDANATDVGNLTSNRDMLSGQSSSENGYSSGGGSTPNQKTIDKFPFSTDANATDVGDLVNNGRLAAGQSSTTHGYSSGGLPANSRIEKFSFSSDGNAAVVANLTQARYSPAGQSSTENGYASGGFSSKNTIDKFPFSVDANATDVGDLTQGRQYLAGQQV